MLLLPSPARRDNDVGISMRFVGPPPGPHVGSLVAGLVLGWGCPRFTADRVEQCMAWSGRYDCRVALSPSALRSLRDHLEQLGVELELTDGEDQP